MKTDSQFTADYVESQHSVVAVSRRIQAAKLPFYVVPARLRPDQSRRFEYADGGADGWCGNIPMGVHQIKNPAKQFTSKADWPFPRVLIDRTANLWPRVKIRAWWHVFVSLDCRHMVCVEDTDQRREEWFPFVHPSGAGDPVESKCAPVSHLLDFDEMVAVLRSLQR